MYSGDQLWWSIPFGILPLCYYIFKNNYCLLLWKMKYLSIYLSIYLSNSWELHSQYTIVPTDSLVHCIMYTIFVVFAVYRTMLRTYRRPSTSKRLGHVSDKFKTNLQICRHKSRCWAAIEISSWLFIFVKTGRTRLNRCAFRERPLISKHQS